MNEHNLTLMFHLRAPSEMIYGHAKKVYLVKNISTGSNLP